MMTEQELAALIRRALPDATITVREFSGGGDHFQAEIISPRFAGLTRVAQHQLVYAELRPFLDSGTVHALALVTRAPEEL